MSAQDEHEAGDEHEHDDAAEDESDQFLLAHSRPYGAQRERLIVGRSPVSHVTATVSDRFRGKRIVVGLYLVVVSLAGVFGAAVGLLLPIESGRDVQQASFAGIEFAVTPLNFAIYGMLMVGVGLGVLLLAVRFVSRFDDEAVDET